MEGDRRKKKQDLEAAEEAERVKAEARREMGGRSRSSVEKDLVDEIRKMNRQSRDQQAKTEAEALKVRHELVLLHLCNHLVACRETDLED
jgi:hypothetical protein